MSETTFEEFRDGLIDRRVERTGCPREDAERLLAHTVDSIHAEAGTLPEALWRYKFCRPADSQAVAARLLAEHPTTRPEWARQKLIVAGAR